MIPLSESGTSSTKHAASWPLTLPAFTRQGVFGMNSRASITSLIAAKNLSLFSPVSALETCPTTRLTMSAHSSKGCPFKSFSEYRLLTTFLALSPSSCDFRRGETAGAAAGVCPTFLPTVALIDLVPFSRGARKYCVSETGVPRRIATQSLSLECYLITTVGLKHHVKRSGIYSFENGVSTNILGSLVF